ncbi:hypothetical protein [Wukongibacter sp. M2B1]|uniref:hypothetical protein n=1 Tax=Wukongibacter sp. M2B1 TaxID=3088895 RepID=UPI003D797C35
MNRKLKIVENIFFISGISLGLYALATTYFSNKGLPPGVCPVNNNRGLFYTSIALLLVSIIFPYLSKTFVQFKKK